MTTIPTDRHEPVATAPAPATEPFSALLRGGTRDVHEAAESTGFVTRLMAGEIGPAGYAAMAAQNYVLYAALEERARTFASDPVAGPFIDERLERLPCLAADLAFLLGPGWRGRVEPLPATARYAERIAGLTWPGDVVAHHYTRYLGDLSGGQAIGRILARTYGLTPGGDGLRFYHFDAVPKPKPYKDAYRRMLDAAPWSADERDRVIAEARVAFALNAAVFADLGARFPAGA